MYVTELTVTNLDSSEAHLRSLNNFNIIMGRNGSGKSRFLRSLEAELATHESRYRVRYISPERAGTFRRDGNVLTNMSNDPTWLRQVRSVNQAENFKAASAMLLRETETMYLRRLAANPLIRNDPTRNFATDRLSKINGLISNIFLQMSNTDFEFRSLSTNELIAPDKISSGESEAVSLATEILYFFDTIDTDKFNVLFLDEPDVHLHPDLQARLGKLLLGMLDEFSSDAKNIAVCVSTHSAPFVCALADSSYVSIGTKNFGVDTIELKPAPGELRKVAPFFGHPLSLALSEDAALIVEGEDDERVWQQAARTSGGRLKVFPVLAGSVDTQSELEVFCVELLTTLYDDPLAFSIRDGDGVVGEKLANLGPLRRFRLSCYAMENLLVTDECLAQMNATWPDFVTKVHGWLACNADHKSAELLRQLAASTDRLRHRKIKEIRQLICAVCESKKPWEVVVGQSIGALSSESCPLKPMLVDYLGFDLVEDIVFRHSK